jgi:hypothetical protein
MGEGTGRCKCSEQGVAEWLGECDAGGLLGYTEMREGFGEAAVAKECRGGERAASGKERKPGGSGAGERGEEAWQVGRDGREVRVKRLRAGGGRGSGGRVRGRRQVGSAGEGAHGGEAREGGGGGEWWAHGGSGSVGSPAILLVE